MYIQAKYGIQQTFYFPLVDFGATDFESTPVSFASGDTQYSIDGGAFGNTNANPAHEGNGIYSLVLTAAETSGSRIVITVIDQTATKTWEDQAIILDTSMSGQLEASAGIIIGEVDNATFTPTTTAFEALAISPNTTEKTVADAYNGRLILFTSGANLGEMTDITDYSLDNSKMAFDVTALTAAPSDGDRFVVL
jgi:hypothetical protein